MRGAVAPIVPLLIIVVVDRFFQQQTKNDHERDDRMIPVIGDSRLFVFVPPPPDTDTGTDTS